MFRFGKKKKIKAEDIFDPEAREKGTKEKRVGKEEKPSFISEGKYPSKPIYREVVFRPRADRVSCPKCGSKLIRPAGYGDRLECQNCGHTFT